MRLPSTPETDYLCAVLGRLSGLLHRPVKDGDRGAMSAEAMIIAGILVVTAIAALGILAQKIIAKANSINLG